MSQSTNQHPLNQAIINQVLHDIRNGQTRKVMAMGFHEQDLLALKEAQLVSLLVNSKVPWVSVTVNQDVLRRIMGQAARDEQQERMIDRALRLGASSALMEQLFGLTHKEVALRRSVLGIPSKKGRWPAITEAQEHDLWDRWNTLQKQYKVDYRDNIAVLDLVMLLVEEQASGIPGLDDGPPLTAIWSTVQSWIDQGLLR
ncbi:coproporphyrinogen III oxidase [Pseudomonas luteola]|uniref:Coproporphyrinogen III oxidase n=1 Tax=Pseudomonas luteola TaxID=47886 RepID=A0A2X2E390_PSELU|nr:MULTISPECIES: DUF2857 domain-containing protein [Pseudomonas]SPZ02529.1 coproporphyrinogen III oxidase [Pseudomonas luteola]